ncbi:unnamed protein product [Ceutorhynchus assimilis]|uniref:Carboxypeptidase n=1 Tax=Ceutorhynchus assimilis TaxID=467358 RepID=A0A9N9MNU3_9CUCU|nr:unnamed protein product [Ceutorhynchus assimilis]
MQYYLILFVVSLTTSLSECGFPNVYKPIQTVNLPLGVDAGEPLILTPYLEQNRIEEAKKAALVTIEGFSSIPSYSGFFTVDKTFDSNMFFWFIPSEGDYKNDPVLLWLQGGPGGSSLYGLFVETGPFVVTNGEELSFRDYRWTKNHSIIYIDNPVGTGFSYTNGGYAQNETKVGEDLYEALIQFFTLFPELQKNEFFITGESYAGKYIPAIGYTIYKKNPGSKLKINLQGLAIGDGLTDPENMTPAYADFLYNIGLIDDNTKGILEKYQTQTVEYIKSGDFLKAFLVFDVILNGDFTRPTLFENATGLENYYNFLANSDEDGSYETFLQTREVRKAIHVGNLSYTSDNVEENLREDVMRSVAPWISELLDNYRVLFYNGQLDVIVAYPLTVNFLKNLNFNGADDYKTAPRKIWRVDGEIAGYAKQAGKMTEVLVRGAGHMVPSDQPKWALDLVYKFVRNLPIA